MFLSADSNGSQGLLMAAVEALDTDRPRQGGGRKWAAWAQEPY